MRSTSSGRGDVLALSRAVLYGVSATIAADAFISFRPMQIAQFLSTVAAFILGAIAYRRRQVRVADPGRVGVLQSLEPAVGAASAWIVLGQMLDGVQIVGGLAVVCSIAVIQNLTSNVAPDAPSPHPI